MESNLVVMKRFTLQAQRGLEEKHQERVGELGDLLSELIMAGKSKSKRDDAEEEDPSDCCGTDNMMTMMIPARIPAFLPYGPPPTSANPAAAIPAAIGQIGPVVGNGIHSTQTELFTQMTRMLCVDTTRDYFQQKQYRLQSTTTTITAGTTTTKVTTELTSNTIKTLEQHQGQHPHHLHHHHHHHHQPLVHHSSGDTSSASSVSSASFTSFEDADVLSSAPTTPVNEKASMDFPIVFGNIEEEDLDDLESNELVLPASCATVAPVSPASTIRALPSANISTPPRPTVEEVTDDELDTKESLQVWHEHKEDDAGALGDDDDSEESDQDGLEEETDSGEEDDDEDEDDSDEEVEGWETEDEEGGHHHHVQITHEVSEISMGGFVFGYSDDDDEEETDSDCEFEDEEEDEDCDCPDDGLFGYDSADDSDDEEASEEEEEEEEHSISVTFVEEPQPHPLRRIDSHRKFDRPPLRPCLSSVSMKREESNCSTNSGGSRVRFSETAERPQIIKTTHFRYSYYEFEAHLKSPACDKELKSTFDDSRTEMEKFQEINFLRESYLSLLDDADAARERENPSNSIVGKVEHILLSKAMESRGEDCTLEDIGLGFSSKANFCMDTLFALIGGKIKLSEFDKKEHAKGNQAPPSTPVASPDASDDEWETDGEVESDDEE
ncbi:hypothetical protein BJ508DRAFT_314809 [Ascobolus immersus RN42]|uniref:Uncharacterized protein n=1 Tax=Ascobolus immersus RN42 TaxID=1160509 RepID=A0A3N4HHY8_ASCIM|nr:hypothetical protein BJ508DRAFT_314809 [Ascobolus immersus RN42]